MTFTVTLQSFLHEHPISRTFETKDEAYDFIELEKQKEQEMRCGWKIEPEIEVQQ